MDSDIIYNLTGINGADGDSVSIDAQTTDGSITINVDDGAILVATNDKVEAGGAGRTITLETTEDGARDDAADITIDGIVISQGGVTMAAMGTGDIQVGANGIVKTEGGGDVSISAADGNTTIDGLVETYERGNITVLAAIDTNINGEVRSFHNSVTVESDTDGGSRLGDPRNGDVEINGLIEAAVDVDVNSHQGNIFGTSDGLVRSGEDAGLIGQLIGYDGTLPFTFERQIHVDVNGTLYIGAHDMINGTSAIVNGPFGSLDDNQHTPGMIFLNGSWVEPLYDPMARGFSAGHGQDNGFLVNELGVVEERTGRLEMNGSGPYTQEVIDQRMKFDVYNGSIFVPYLELLSDLTGLATITDVESDEDRKKKE